MKRKILSAMLSITLLLGITGCSNPIQVEEMLTTAIIVDTKYTAPFQTPMYNAITKTRTFIHHPADYDTYIKYNNILYNLDSKKAYDICHGNNGQEIDIIYIIKYYKNGTIETSIKLKGGIN